LVRQHARPTGPVLTQDSRLRLALIDAGAMKETMSMNAMKAGETLSHGGSPAIG
jgi:hypothetical protein